MLRSSTYFVFVITLIWVSLIFVSCHGKTTTSQPLSMDLIQQSQSNMAPGPPSPSTQDILLASSSSTAPPLNMAVEDRKEVNNISSSSSPLDDVYTMDTKSSPPSPPATPQESIGAETVQSTASPLSKAPPPEELSGKEEAPHQPSSKKAAESIKPPSPPSPDVKTDAPESEVMPSFDEWKKMMLAEQERDGGKKSQSSSQGSNAGSGPGGPGKKTARRRNYSSNECGAKVVASNPEADSPGHMLNEQMDEYMLNPCKVKIWFVIELCESIQAAQIELANFELFSSTPKDFAVWGSDRFPTREWTSMGTYTAPDLRSLHSFQLPSQGFVKFIKVEMLSHYGSEHYCPLSVVRVFGTSMVDEYEEMETADRNHDDDDERIDSKEELNSQDLFGSAKEAVIRIVKQVLTLEDENKSVTINETLTTGPSTTELFFNNNQSIEPSEKLPTYFNYCKSKMEGIHLDKFHSPRPANEFCQFLQMPLHKICPLKVRLESSHSSSPIVTASAASEMPPEALLIQPTRTLQSSLNGEPIQSETSSQPSEEIISTTVVIPSPELEEKDFEEPSKGLVKEAGLLEEDSLQDATDAVNLTDELTTLPFEDLEPDKTHPTPPEVNIGSNKQADTSSGSRLEPAPVGGSGGQQKESVFMRMGSRIKALELNMSLSSQYLQELSQRYRRQMEEMQRSFNHTVALLNETARHSYERDLEQQATIRELQAQLANLSVSISGLLADREHLQARMMTEHLCLMLGEVIFILLIFSYCIRGPSPPAEDYGGGPISKRHRSLVLPHSPLTRVIKRSASQEQLSPSHRELLIIEPPASPEPPPPPKVKKKKHKKGNNNNNIGGNQPLHRSMSNPMLLPPKSSQVENSTPATDLLFLGPPSSDPVLASPPRPLQNLTNRVPPMQPPRSSSPNGGASGKKQPPPSTLIKIQRTPSV